jgi:O-succinylbenzoate synthase
VQADDPRRRIRNELAIAERIGVPVVISGSLDSGIGLTTCLAAAAALTDLPLASGLGTGALLVEDLTASAGASS